MRPIIKNVVGGILGLAAFFGCVLGIFVLVSILYSVPVIGKLISSFFNAFPAFSFLVIIAPGVAGLSAAGNFVKNDSLKISHKIYIVLLILSIAVFWIISGNTLISAFAIVSAGLIAIYGWNLI